MEFNPVRFAQILQQFRRLSDEQLWIKMHDAPHHFYPEYKLAGEFVRIERGQRRATWAAIWTAAIRILIALIVVGLRA